MILISSTIITFNEHYVDDVDMWIRGYIASAGRGRRPERREERVASLPIPDPTDLIHTRDIDTVYVNFRRYNSDRRLCGSSSSGIEIYIGVRSTTFTWISFTWILSNMGTNSSPMWMDEWKLSIQSNFGQSLWRPTYCKGINISSESQDKSGRNSFLSILQLLFQKAMEIQRSGRPQNIAISSSPVGRRRVAANASFCITPIRSDKKSAESLEADTSSCEKKNIGSRRRFAAHQDLFPNLDDVGCPVGETVSFKRLQHDFAKVYLMKYSRCENCETQYIPTVPHGNSGFCSGDCRWSWTVRLEKSMHKLSSSSTVSFDCDDQYLLDDSDDEDWAELWASFSCHSLCCNGVLLPPVSFLFLEQAMPEGPMVTNGRFSCDEMWLYIFYFFVLPVLFVGFFLPYHCIWRYFFYSFRNAECDPLGNGIFSIFAAKIAAKSSFSFEGTTRIKLNNGCFIISM